MNKVTKRGRVVVMMMHEMAWLARFNTCNISLFPSPPGFPSFNPSHDHARPRRSQ